MTEVSHDLAAYAVKVIDAIRSVKGEVSYGEFHVGPVPLLFDNEATGWEVAEVDNYWALRSVDGE